MITTLLILALGKGPDYPPPPPPPKQDQIVLVATVLPEEKWVACEPRVRNSPKRRRRRWKACKLLKHSANQKNLNRRGLRNH